MMNSCLQIENKSDVVALELLKFVRELKSNFVDDRILIDKKRKINSFN